MEGTTETETTTTIASPSPHPLQLNNNYCCAYLCNLCPRISFHSMELLDQHMRDEHQGNENKLKMKENVKIEENNEKEQQINQQPETIFDQSEVEQQQHLLNSSNLSTSPSSAFSIPQPPQNNLTIINKLADLTCKKCPGGKTFTSREHLELHNTNTHRDRPQYCCNQCGALFSVKRELATHLRVHSGEQPHQCEKCGKEFGTRQLLKKHTMWHTGERSHVCPSCGKAFFQKGHLTQHLMIHKGGRPHKCSLCSKTFIFKFDLNRHLKIHTDRSFVCGRCSKCFQQEVELEGHVLNCKRSSANIIRRNKRPSKRREPFFNNSTNIEENEIQLKKPSLTFKNEEESNNEQYNEFMKKNETNGGNDQVSFYYF
uniref:C2H2-type domain-containing protein n=1 Tax=Meloidogyne incognita TaxID=6306 RepID=A0A914M839_MELIC